MKKLFLIDGNSFCYRAFYAIKELSNSKGQPTNAVYGFVSMLNKILNQQRPDYMAVSFDLKGPTFRHKKYDAYKIHRKPMPEGLISQMPIIKDVVAAYNIPIFQVAGFEADDVLATIVKKCKSSDLEVYIATGDKDVLQLVDSRTMVWSPHFKEDVIYDVRMVNEKFGVGPERIRDFMSLMGDTSDNIPGVPGIGPKTAAELIHEFSTLENILSSVDSIKRESTRQAIKGNFQAARMSYELATLDCDVPIEVDLTAMRLKEPDRERLYAIFKELEFKSLLKEFSPAAAPQAAVDYVLVRTEDKFKELLLKLGKAKEFALDFETTDTDPMLAEPVGISFCWKEKEAYYVPIKSVHSSQFKVHSVLERLKPILEDERIGKIGQNIKYEMVILANQGIGLKGVVFDTMVASYLLNPSKANHNLEDIALEYLDYRMSPTIDDLLGKGKSRITMDKVALEEICRYCCQDSDVTLRLKNILGRRLEDKGLYGLFCDIELPLIEVLADMERWGFAIDTDYLGLMSARIEKDLTRLTGQIYEIAGGEFNINSPRQLSEVLFEKLKLPVVKRTKTGASTDEGVLQKLASKHALPAAILEYRQLFKLKSTYIDALPALVNPGTGRVHTSFNQTVTATGRLSSSEPNLQNIPIKTELGSRIRKAFVPSSAKNRILSADYSQIELRILAHISDDDDMIEAFKKGRDIHAHTASLIYGTKEKDVTDRMRSSAKTVNFGIIYGMSPWGLSRDLGISQEEATAFIEAYFARYPKVRMYMQDAIEKARSDGYVTTIMNRRRWIPNINSDDINIRQFAERTAINTPIQGSAADLIKIAMIDISRKLKSSRFKTRMILQVHDELVFDVPKDELNDAAALVKRMMEGVARLKVPLAASIKAGDNWLETKEVKG
jgi:DNA polymerase-1